MIAPRLPASGAGTLPRCRDAPQPRFPHGAPPRRSPPAAWWCAAPRPAAGRSAWSGWAATGAFPKAGSSPARRRPRRRSVRSPRRRDRRSPRCACWLRCPPRSTSTVALGALVFKRVHHFLVETGGDSRCPTRSQRDRRGGLAVPTWHDGAPASRTPVARDARRALLEARSLTAKRAGEAPRIGGMRLFDTGPRSVGPLEPRGDASGSTSAGSRRTTPPTSVTPSRTTPSTCSPAACAPPASVRSVRNVTDVDDDILRVARERGVDYRALADRAGGAVRPDMAALELLPVDAAPRATAHVAAMVELDRAAGRRRRGLRGADGWVYFEVEALPGLRRLSRLDRDTMIALSRRARRRPGRPAQARPARLRALAGIGARASRAGQSPGAPGRPGWHIECTVLRHRGAGPAHRHPRWRGRPDLPAPRVGDRPGGGGAGSQPVRAALGARRAWSGIEGVKMSKSLGNLVWVRDLVARVGAGPVRLMLCRPPPSHRVVVRRRRARPSGGALGGGAAAAR